MAKTKILIIDDDQVIANMYAARFSRGNFEVEIANSGKDGLQKIKEGKRDIILLDLAMYPADGYEVLAEIKKMRLAHASKIIVFSNLSQKEDIERAMLLGASDYIVKANVTPSEALRRVENIIANKMSVET
jgi:DNA-binding response OmpR family regulator